MSKSVKIIIAAVSIITVGFFTVVGFFVFGFFGWVTVSVLFGRVPDSTQSRIINSMPEYSDEKVYFFGASDGIEYIEFYYDKNFSSQHFEDNEYFKKVTESDFETIYEYVDTFEEDIQGTYNDIILGYDIKKVYSFSKSMVDTDDYFYTLNKKKFMSYSLYYYDSDTKTAFQLRVKKRIVNLILKELE